MFDAKVFTGLFETEEDWAAFFEMVKADEIEALKRHDSFLGRSKEGLCPLFLKMADVRSEARYAADEEWRQSDDYEKYADDLARVDASIGAYREWKARRKEEDLDTPLCDRAFYDTKKDSFGHRVPCEDGEAVGSKIAKEIA